MLCERIIVLGKYNSKMTARKYTKYSLSTSKFSYYQSVNSNRPTRGFGGLEVACWPLVPTFAGSNPKKSSARLPSEGK